MVGVSSKLKEFLICSISILTLSPSTSANLRYTEKSCVDLTPRPYDEYTNVENLYASYSTSKSNLTIMSTKEKRWRSNYAEIPFKISATGRRYRRDSDVVVQIEGSAFDALMLQARHLPKNGDEYGFMSTVIGGIDVVVVVGQFRYLKFPFKYLTCFDCRGATVIDDRKPIKLGNLSFVWRAPDQNVGDIRFIASILRGVQFWVIVSNMLTFNPFPISSYSCGSTLACFRVCPFDEETCSPRDALLVLTYHVDSDRRDIEFTLGGRLQMNNSYLAVAFGEEYENLRQADMMACWLDHGKARIEHFLIENILLPPYLHPEIPIQVDDSDYHVDEHGHNMLWCRFRKSINPLSPPFFNITKPLYHFHFWGTIDSPFQRFILPKQRNQIYTSANKRNISHSINEILSTCSKIMISWFLIMISITFIML